MADHALDLVDRTIPVPATLPVPAEPAKEARVRSILLPAPELQPANDDHPHLPERLAPDLPPAIGFMLVGTFLWIIGAYVITFWGDLQTMEMVAVDLAYVAVYVGVPWIVLKIEPKTGPQPTLAEFLQRGMQTFTGHLTGTEALIQILTIPVSLAVATTALCLVARLA